MTAIIPNWNGRARLARLLAGLGAQSRPADEIVVVDNGSDDGSVEMARGHGATVLGMGANAGFARAVNRGVEAARTPWAAILNNDLEPAGDWLERLLERAQQRRAGFATGRVLSFQHRPTLDGTYDALCRGGGRGGSARGVRTGRCRRPRARSAWRRCPPPWCAPSFSGRSARSMSASSHTWRTWNSSCARRWPAATASRSRRPWRATPAAPRWARWHRDTVRMISWNQMLLVAKHYSAGELARCGLPSDGSQRLLEANPSLRGPAQCVTFRFAEAHRGSI